MKYVLFWIAAVLFACGAVAAFLPFEYPRLLGIMNVPEALLLSGLVCFAAWSWTLRYTIAKADEAPKVRET